jgi:chromosome segregation ATPase
MGIIFSSDLDDWHSVINNHAQVLDELRSRCDRLEKITAFNVRTSQGDDAQNTESSADVQSLSKKVEDINSENSRLRADIAALSTKIDQSTTGISYWKAEVEAITANFHDILSAEVNTMNTKYQALSTKVDNGFNNSTPAINRGLAIGLPLGLGLL